MTAGGSLISTAVIAALGVAASLLLWQTLESERRAELERGTAVVAGSLALSIAARIEDQDLGALRRWGSGVLASAEPERWREDAELFLADHPAFAALGRIENGEVADVAGSAKGRESLRALAPETAALLRPSEAPKLPSEAMTGPLRLPDGRSALAIRIGMPRAEGGTRLTLALYVPEGSIRQELEQRALGYAVRVQWGSEQVFQNSLAASEPAVGPGWSLEPVRLSAGPELSVVARASESLNGDARRKAPLIALVAGLLISALIASLVHVSQIARARAAALVEANLALRERMQATADVENEIRRLNAILETRVAERTAALQETIAELETFNYSVSHDLRSPLGAILNFAAILSQDHGESLDANAREYLRRITASANGVVSLMDGLLAFSRSGREELRKARVDVQRLVEALRDEQVTERGGACKIQIGELPPAYADPAMLRLMFANLISNACKFVRSGDSPNVEIGGRVEGKNVVYFVRDHGIGFDMRYAEKLFGVFERLHVSDDFDGHGVGLAIVARLARRHGGRTWAEGALGKGATFHIELPREDGRDGGRAPLYV